jgi:hypothetical protein
MSSGDVADHSYSRSENGCGEKWSVPRLWEAAKGLPAITVAIADIPGILEESWLKNWHDQEDPDVKFEATRTARADLSYPVLLHPDGYLMDGYHRIGKALQAGATTIRAIRFTPETLPAPDFTWNSSWDAP